jgi:hypothetical protein
MKAIYAIGLSITLVGAAQARPHHQPPVPPAQVLSRQGDRLLLSRDHGWRKEVLLDVNTNYDSNQPPAAGDFLDVRDELRADGLYHAVSVRRFQGHPVHGKVLALNDNGFLLDNHGEPLQVDVSSTTQYKMGPIPGHPLGPEHQPSCRSGWQAGRGRSRRSHPGERPLSMDATGPGRRTVGSGSRCSAEAPA